MKARNWCFTLNNYSHEELMSIVDAETCCYSYCIFGMERQQTDHLQGYMELDEPKGLNHMKEIIKRAHWERRRGTQLEAINYCKKEGNWHEFGELKHQGDRTDWKNIICMIKDGNDLCHIAEEYPSQSAMYWNGISNLYHECKPKADTVLYIEYEMIYCPEWLICRCEEDLQLYDNEKGLMIENKYEWANNYLMQWGHNCPVKIKNGFRTIVIKPEEVHIWNNTGNNNRRTPDWYCMTINQLAQKCLGNTMTQDTITECLFD